MKMSLVVIPNCIEGALRSGGASLSVLKDPKALLSILSKSDVAFYFYCQELASRFANYGNDNDATIHPDLIKTFFVNSYDCSSDLGNSVSDELQLDLRRLISDFHFSNHSRSIRPLYDGQFDTTSGGNAYSDYAFDTVEVSEDTLGLRLVPLSRDESAQAQELASYDKLLQILTRYVSLRTVATTPAFARFVELNHVGLYA